MKIKAKFSTAELMLGLSLAKEDFANMSHYNVCYTVGKCEHL